MATEQIRFFTVDETDSWLSDLAPEGRAWLNRYAHLSSAEERRRDARVLEIVPLGLLSDSARRERFKEKASGKPNCPFCSLEDVPIGYVRIGRLPESAADQTDHIRALVDCLCTYPQRNSEDTVEEYRKCAEEIEGRTLSTPELEELSVRFLRLPLLEEVRSLSPLEFVGRYAARGKLNCPYCTVDGVPSGIVVLTNTLRDGTVVKKADFCFCVYPLDMDDPEFPRFQETLEETQKIIEAP